MSEMEMLLKEFNDAYNWLYDNDKNDYVNYLEEYAMERFEAEMKSNKKFKDYVIEFVSFRNDCLSSDRECAAFMLAIRM